nr:geranylgeranyl transferase type-2 subunit alpha [Ciona intestinalis]|eukprot:XP_002128835.1 geranylgeranyl transferase type-2 subunit alpha [Ciona intestinalis]
MHGRLKVKTTAVQEEEKRIKRQKKLKLFQGALAAAFKKIHSKEYDPEGLYITQEILAANSDYYTIWNYRKNAFLHFKNTKTSDELLKCFQDELSFLQNCLKNNPKSYSCWNQRCFVLLTMSDPDWKKELQLCDLFLQFDDRNFHCWDYRRFVVQHSAVLPGEEIQFTHKLIENNFSNYSSWHYRSKLLPIECPDASDKNRIGEKMLLEELELVQNAFFTDPNDQSAWFYHRWLLGRGETKQSLLSLHVSLLDNKLTCTLRKPASIKDCSRLNVYINDNPHVVVWKGCNQGKYQHVWQSDLPKKDLFSGENKIKVEFGSSELMVEMTGQDEAISCIQTNTETFRQSSSDAKLSVLTEELKSCEELNDLEPGNKWVMLTLVLLMRAIDPTHYSSQVHDTLHELCTVDGMRQCYYQDLMSKFVIEDHIAAVDLHQRCIDLHGKALTRVCRFEFFSTITSLNLSHNQLHSLNSPFKLLHCLQKLDVSENEIVEISGLKDLTKLVLLNLDSNKISSLKTLEPVTTCAALQKISVKSNRIPLEDIDSLLQILPNVEIVYES